MDTYIRREDKIKNSNIVVEKGCKFVGRNDFL